MGACRNFCRGGIGKPKKAPRKDKRGAERPHLVKKVSVREKSPHIEKSSKKALHKDKKDLPIKEKRSRKALTW